MKKNEKNKEEKMRKRNSKENNKEAKQTKLTKRNKLTSIKVPPVIEKQLPELDNLCSTKGLRAWNSKAVVLKEIIGRHRPINKAEDNTP